MASPSGSTQPAPALAQDHHCIFLNNCVGRHTRKAFGLLTLYTVLLAAFLLLTSAPLLSQALTTYGWCPLFLVSQWLLSRPPRQQ